MFRNLRGGFPARIYSNEESAIAAKIRAGNFNVIGVQTTYAEEYYAPGTNIHLPERQDSLEKSGKKKERHDLCIKADQEEMEKDPWYAEIKRMHELQKEMLQLEASDSIEHKKAYTAYLREIRQIQKTQARELLKRDAEWEESVEKEKNNKE